MEDMVSIFKALADLNRLKVLCALESGPLCSCQVAELLGLAPSTVSRHMQVLRGAGLTESRKQERWVFYELPGRDAPERVKKTLKLLRGMYEDTPELKEMKDKVEKIISIGPVELCRRKKDVVH